jgi:glycosyltransferase involved in cell wall biosynthesis/GT2 family glycosyltransferase
MIAFSIVINTLDRAAWLQRTLASLTHLRYAGRFEVIVVQGPCSDDTPRVLDAWRGRIRTGACPAANLSMSRNIGIRMARGDVVAFIDDDAIPEPEWLTHLAAAYADPQVGGAGGKVCDRSGYTFQYEYATATRLAETDWRAPHASEALCFPGSFRFPYLQGTNASFRRTALLEVGGFDEEIEYFLDETDLCCRLVDAGFLIKQLPNAYVHHEAAPNAVRNAARLTVAAFPILKNALYFSIKHGLPYFPLSHIEQVHAARTAAQRANVAHLIAGGHLPPAALAEFDAAATRAAEIGQRRGLDGPRPGIDAAGCVALPGGFLPFATRTHAGARTVVLVSRDYPPGHRGGIAVLYRDLAEALAQAGHQVHVVTEGRDEVGLENGVWIHRMAVRRHVRPPDAVERRIPQPIWDWCATALAETRRIASLRPVDVVEAPIWDAEGAALLLDGGWPLVTSLQTTLHFWLQAHPALRNDPDWMREFGTPMLALEEAVMRGAHAVRAISHAIRRDIEQAYGFAFDPAAAMVIPLGMPDTAAGTDAPAPPGRDAAIEVLFVGRLEARKGIDVLLAALEHVLAADPAVRVRILGDNTIPRPGERTSYLDAWREQGQLRRWAGRVVFEGRVDDATLRTAYRACDLFVAPSRFESFGLVFLEAMREGKPVIGCHAGGMPEVVADGVNGILVPPGDSDALAAAILRLAADAPLRAAMGAAGRARFLARFSAQRMAQASLPLFDLARARCAGWTP